MCKQWNIKEAKIIAKIRDPEGDCLSTEYVNMHKHLLWKCGNPNHPTWLAELNSVSRGSWCPLCWEERKGKALTTITVEKLHKIAADRGGQCLSKEYHNGDKIKWKCKNGHVFYKTYDQIVQCKQWCTKCSPWRSEELTRQIFQAIFKVKFTKTTLGKLGIEGSGKLELDGYNPDLHLAFEYQGRQHYEVVFTRQDLKQIQFNDKKKAELCKKNSINLIVVPHFPRNKKVDYWKHIEKILEGYGFKDLKYKKTYDLEAIFYKDYKQEIEKIIVDHGGKLLSKEILNATTDIEIECEQGHIFRMTPHKLKQGQWCRHAMPNRPLTEKEIIDTVEHFGGKVVSIQKGTKHRLINCICEEGHHFSREINEIRNGYWCKYPDHKGKKRFKPYTKRSDKYSVDNRKK